MIAETTIYLLKIGIIKIGKRKLLLVKMCKEKNSCKLLMVRIIFEGIIKIVWVFFRKKYS